MPATFSVSDLYEAVEYADARMLPLRRLRTEAIQEYGGRFWYEDDRKQRPLNLVQRGVKVLVAHLSARNPRFEVTTERLQFRAQARKFSKQLEQRADKAGRVKFSRLCMLEAFFGGKAVVRIGQRSTADVVRVDDRFVHRGEVYTRLVSLDNWIFDPAATDDASALFEGERYRMSREKALAAVDQGIFGLDVDAAVAEVQSLPPESQGQAMEELSLLQEYGFLDAVATPEEARQMLQAAPKISDGRTTRMEDRAEDLTAGDLTDEQRYSLVDTIELTDLAFYVDAETCVLLTLLSEKGSMPKLLRAEVWDGPSRGPYEHLEFDPIPDNPHGPSVVSAMREQSEIANTVIGKMVNQIERTKRILVYQKKRTGDALKITKAHDGASVAIDGDPREMQAVDLGGIAADLAPFAQLIIGYWNMQGSFDVLGAQAGGPKRTATEDQRLGVTASILVESLADLFDDFQNRLVQHEAWYLWEDPFIVAPLTMRVQGSHQIEVVYSAQQRMGTFNDYTFKIRPRSMQRVDPNVATQRMLELFETVMRAAEVAVATGGMVDPAAVARLLGRRFEEDDLDEILRDPILMQQIADLYAPVPMPAPPVMGAAYPGLDQIDYRARVGEQGGTGQRAPGRSMTPGRPRMASALSQRQSVMQSAYAPAFSRAS